jgi:hypothetical protein
VLPSHVVSGRGHNWPTGGWSTWRPGVAIFNFNHVLSCSAVSCAVVPHGCAQCSPAVCRLPERIPCINNHTMLHGARRRLGPSPISNAALRRPSPRAPWCHCCVRGLKKQ